VKIRSFAVVALLALAVAAPAQKKAAVYKTPQAVFDAAAKAQAVDDFQTYVGCYAPKLQAAWVSFYGSTLAEARAEELKKSAEVGKELARTLDRHGLTVKAWAKIEKEAGGDPAKAAKALEAVVKDHAAFLVDALKLLKKGGFSLREIAGEGERKLTDVKVDGDRATGTVVVTWTDREKRKRERKETVTFAKVGGGWRIEEENRSEPKKK
jgi:hypothetical protein